MKITGPGEYKSLEDEMPGDGGKRPVRPGEVSMKGVAGRVGPREEGTTCSITWKTASESRVFL